MNIIYIIKINIIYIFLILFYIFLFFCLKIKSKIDLKKNIYIIFYYIKLF